MTSIHPPFSPIETERLILRRFRDEDAPTLIAYRNDPEVGRYQGWESYTDEELTEWVHELASNESPRPGSWFQIAVEEKGSGTHIGNCGLLLRGSEPRQGVLGYTFARRAQGQGYATEAVSGVLGYAFEHLGLHRVMADALADNARSIRLLERLGFTLEGRFRESDWFEGRWTDSVIYGLLAREWAERGNDANFHRH